MKLKYYKLIFSCGQDALEIARSENVNQLRESSDYHCARRQNLRKMHHSEISFRRQLEICLKQDFDTATA